MLGEEYSTSKSFSVIQVTTKLESIGYIIIPSINVNSAITLSMSSEN